MSPPPPQKKTIPTHDNFPKEFLWENPPPPPKKKNLFPLTVIFQRNSFERTPQTRAHSVSNSELFWPLGGYENKLLSKIWKKGSPCQKFLTI